MNAHELNGEAVSEVVGEMLMIGLVLILIAVFSTSISSFLPTERQPSITIKLTNETDRTIKLWHKGGDWIKISDLKIMVSNSSENSREIVYRASDAQHPILPVPVKGTFDLGSNITITWDAPLQGNETVKLVVPRSVIFSGRFQGAE